MTQIAICNGEPLFQVDYEDPDYNNQYFDDAHILDDNDDGDVAGSPVFSLIQIFN